jgi:hypothetical protein
MPNYSLNRLQRAYLGIQTDIATIPTVVTANNVLFSKLSLDASAAAIKDPAVTGSRQSLESQRGRMTGAWSIDTVLRGSGAAGTAPPHLDVLLQSVFGHANTAVASTSNTYNMTDDIINFALFRYRHDQAGGVALTNHIGSLCGTTDATFTMGADLAQATFNGSAAFVLDSDNFASYVSAWKGGLSSFPAEPTAPTAIPTLPVIGFTGSITTDSDSVVELKTATIKVSTGNTLVDDSYGQFIGSGWQGDERTIELSLTLDDSDSAAIIDLKQKAFSFTPIDIVIVSGTVAGNIFTFTLKQVQMQNVKFSEGPKGRMRVDFSASMAHGTTLAGLDAFKLAIT